MNQETSRKKIIFEELKIELEKAWSRETCYPGCQNEWNPNNKTLGQCAITSLIINDYLDGKIMKTIVNDIGHYFNLIDNEVIDLTVDQFLGIIPNYKDSIEKTREYILENEDTNKRYTILKNKINKRG